MPSALASLQWLTNEFGVMSVYSTGRDAYFLILARSCRMFAFGGASLILALFFSALGVSDSRIGLFMTLALIGDVLLSLLLTLIADRIGRRKVLLSGAVLMVLSGAIFALFENYWILLVAAVVGVLSATGSDAGPFRAIEESVLSHLTQPRTRSDVLSWYVVDSTLGSAAGTQVAGRVVDVFTKKEGWGVVRAYHAVFWAYVVMGLVVVVLTLLLTKRCEVAVQPSVENEAAETLLDGRQEGDQGNDAVDLDDSEIVAHDGNPVTSPQRYRTLGMLGQIQPDTRSIMYKLWFLLTVDALADGMTSYALTTYYMDGKFHPTKTVLGAITSAGYFLAAAGTFFAGPLSKRLGLIRTMVFTHIPSSAAVLLFPIPRSLAMTIVLFFVRTGLNNMDQAPRTAFIAAVVRPEERTAVMGITNILKTLGSAVGPSITGVLAGNDRFWIAFVVAGTLRLCYDLGLWAMFVNMKLDMHEGTAASGGDVGRVADEEVVMELENLDRTSFDDRRSGFSSRGSASPVK